MPQLVLALLLAGVALFQLGSIFGVPFWIALALLAVLVIVVIAVFA